MKSANPNQTLGLILDKVKLYLGTFWEVIKQDCYTRKNKISLQQDLNSLLKNLYGMNNRPGPFYIRS